MKNIVIKLLQRILGFENYLFIFAIWIIRKLPFDKNERDFIHLFTLLPDGGTVLDIGANIGVMTTHFSKRLPFSQVFSFEPIPQNINTLKRIVRHYKLQNIKIFEFALGEKFGQVDMIMPIINNAKKHGLSHILPPGAHAESGIEFKVEVKCLDDVPEIINIQRPITAIKIDVEGFELPVLKGAKMTIKKHRPVIYCELWDNKDRRNTISFLSKLGYKTKVMKRNKLVKYKNQKTQNFFFIP
jgi:FkbM family methyltransferase